MTPNFLEEVNAISKQVQRIDEEISTADALKIAADVQRNSYLYLIMNEISIIEANYKDRIKN